MDQSSIVSHSTEETMARGRELASQMRAPLLVLLNGDLGAGKTTLTKGIIGGLGVAREEEVTSPTFTLVHCFTGPVKVYHVDLYRVEGVQEFDSLGLEDLFMEPAIVIIEWPERMRLRTDWPVVRVELAHVNEDSRTIIVSGAKE